MGDFERTFGAGADAVAIVQGFVREQASDLNGGRGSHPRAASKIGRSVEGDTIFADLGLGLQLVKKASIDTFFDEANLLDADERLHGNDHTLFVSYGNKFSPVDATNVEGALFLVLRDSHDSTCALVVVVDSEVRHVLGLLPQQVQISDILFGAFRDRKWIIGTDFASFGWITDETGKWHAVNHLPDRLTVSTNFDLRDSTISVLPEELTVSGDLNLSGTKIERLPNRLTVGGDLHLENTVLRRLPKELTVGHLMFCDGFRVVLPSRGSVTDEFDVHCIPLPSRPSVTVGGNLYLDLAALAILPRGATVIAPSLDFGYSLTSLIDRMPDGVICMGVRAVRHELFPKTVKT